METLSDKRKAYLTGENQYGERAVKEFIRELKKAWNDLTRLESMDDWINNHAGDKLI